MNRPLTRWRVVSLATLAGAMAGCFTVPVQQVTPSTQTRTGMVRDELRAATAGEFFTDIAMGVPSVRETLDHGAENQGIGQVVVGLFDYGTAANEVARLGWVTIGGYLSETTKERLQASTLKCFAKPHAFPLTDIVGTPTAYNSKWHRQDSLVNGALWDNLKNRRLEPRRFMVRDFLNGASLMQNGVAAKYVRFGNLAADDGTGVHRYLAFAVAWDNNKYIDKRKVLGYTDALVDPASSSSPVALKLVLNEDVSTDSTNIGVTVQPTSGCQSAQP
jgi:hypothetical protein